MIGGFITFSRASRSYWWIRIGLGGLLVQGLHRSQPPLFSERNGHKRFFPAWPRTAWRVRIAFGER